MAKHRRHPLDKRGTRQWRGLVARVLAEEPICWLRLAGCTYRATTGDHVIPVNIRPDLCMVRANVRGACFHCNSARHDTPVDQLPSRTAPRVHEAIAEWWDE